MFCLLIQWKKSIPHFSHRMLWDLSHSSFSSEIKWLLSMHQVHAKLCCSTCTCIVMVDCYSVCFYSSEEEHQFQCSSSEGILEVTTHSCQCKFWDTMHLPCRHIFAIRDRTRCNLYCEELVAPRWTLGNMKAVYEMKYQLQYSGSDCFEVYMYHVYGFVFICHRPTVMSTGNGHLPGGCHYCIVPTPEVSPS